MFSSSIKLCQIKDIICTQGQDKVPEEHKAGVVYITDCMIHTDFYVGQTGKPNKERSYQHGIITHAEATLTKAIKFNDLTKQREPAPLNVKLRSEKERNRPDYAEMHTMVVVKSSHQATQLCLSTRPGKNMTRET